MAPEAPAFIRKMKKGNRKRKAPEALQETAAPQGQQIIAPQRRTRPPPAVTVIEPITAPNVVEPITAPIVIVPDTEDPTLQRDPISRPIDTEMINDDWVPSPPTFQDNPSPPREEAIPPPPPAELSTQMRGSLWNSGVSPLLSSIIRPPPRYSEPIPFTNDEMNDLIALEVNGLKCVGLAQALASSNTKYSRAYAELQICREEKQKTYEELLLVKSSCQKAEGRVKELQLAQESLQSSGEALKNELQSVRDELQSARDDLKVSESELQETKKKFQDKTAELLTLESTYAFNMRSLSDIKVMHEKSEATVKSLQLQLAEMAKKVEAAEKETESLRDDLEDSVELSFNNTLSQIRFLNPDVVLNTNGMHYKAFVADGQLCPPSPAEVTEINQNAQVEEGEEVNTDGVGGIPVEGDGRDPDQDTSV